MKKKLENTTNKQPKKITIKQIKLFIEKESGLEISHKDGYYTKRKNDKVFLRWFFIYMCHKYSNDYITNKKLGEAVKIKPCTVYLGLNSFYDLIKYDKKISRNFKSLEDIFIEKFNPDEKDVLDIMAIDQLKLLKDHKNIRSKIKKDKMKINYLECRIEKLKKQIN